MTDLLLDNRRVDLKAGLKQQRTDDGIKTTYELAQPLTGRIEHKVERFTTVTQDLRLDPFYVFEALNFCRVADIRIYLMRANIDVHFRRIGMDEGFASYPVPGDTRGAVRVLGFINERLLFPGQGCMLLFLKKTEIG